MYIKQFLTALPLFGALAEAIQLNKRTDGRAPAVVPIDFEKTRVPKNKNKDRRRKEKAYAVDISNEKTLYNAQIKLGSPSQKIEAQLDTGSSDLWVNSPDSQICKSKGNPCKSSGTYNKTASTSYKKVNSDFSITYVDGTNASGDYVTDVLKFGDMKINTFQFGLGLESTSDNCVLGIGYPENEVYVSNTGNKPYANLPQALVDGGLINSRAYSLYLDDYRSEKGQVLFGGVDTEKFQGELATIPLIKSSGSDVYTEFAIALTGVKIDVNNNETTAMKGALSVVLDSGSTFNNLPPTLVNSINKVLNGFYYSKGGIDVVPCSVMNSEDSMTFTFSGANIKVPMEQIVLPPSFLGLGELTDDSGTKMCVLGITPLDSDDDQAILGDTFLRSSYVVYDLDNNEIAIAAANYNATKTNILEIGTGTSAIPSATGVASAVTTGKMDATGIPGSFSGGGANSVSSEDLAARPTAMPDQLGAVFAGLAGAGMVFAAL